MPSKLRSDCYRVFFSPFFMSITPHAFELPEFFRTGLTLLTYLTNKYHIPFSG